MNAQAEACGAYRAFIRDVRTGGDLKAAHTFLNDHLVTKSTRGFVVQSWTLRVGDTEGGPGGKCPLELKDPEASAEVFIAHIPSATDGGLGHYVALLEAAPGTSVAPVEKRGDYYLLIQLCERDHQVD